MQCKGHSFYILGTFRKQTYMGLVNELLFFYYHFFFFYNHHLIREATVQKPSRYPKT